MGKEAEDINEEYVAKRPKLRKRYQYMLVRHITGKSRQAIYLWLKSRDMCPNEDGFKAVLEDYYFKQNDY